MLLTTCIKFKIRNQIIIDIIIIYYLIISYLDHLCTVAGLPKKHNGLSYHVLKVNLD